MNVGEMFAGIGGFRHGLEETASLQGFDGSYQGEHKEAGSGSGSGLDAGRNDGKASYRVVWANELDKYACQVYRKHYGSAELVEGDIRDVNTASIPDIDLLCAGFPCQTFSYAGKRSGTDTARGTLFAQIVRVASAKRPKFLLLENVRGLLSSSDGRDFAVILRVLGSLGYILQWEVLDSQHHGVPQHRERVFVVGHLGAECFRQVFPLREDGSITGAPPAAPRREGQRLRSGSLSGYGRLGGEKEAVADTVNARYYKCGPENLVIQQHSFSGDGGRGRGYRVFEGYVPTLATQMGTGGNNVPMVLEKPTRVAEEMAGAPGENCQIPVTPVTVEKFGSFHSQSPQRVDEVAHTVRQDLGRNVSKPHNPILFPNGSLRRLTPVECERLQAFPDGWTAEGLSKSGEIVKLSDTQRYKLLGNAVTTSVVKIVAERLFN